MLVAWVVAVTHLAQSLHNVVVSHSVCATHGELVHDEAGHDDAASEAPHSADRQVASTESSEHHDEHCQAVATESSSISGGSMHAPPTLLSFGLLPVSDHDISLSRRQLLLLAPKTSPPV